MGIEGPPPDRTPTVDEVIAANKRMIAAQQGLASAMVEFIESAASLCATATRVIETLEKGE